MENTEHTNNPNSAATDPYHLEFGKHAGKPLSKVPSDYIDWLIRNQVHANRPPLATALRALGKLDAPPAATHQDTKWKAPSVSQAKERCFFDPFLGDPLWISDRDAATYFNLSDPALANAGVRRHGSNRRWLYPVFACAEHWKTTASGTARQALQRFLSKNQRREDEIMAGMGLGCGL